MQFIIKLNNSKIREISLFDPILRYYIVNIILRFQFFTRKSFIRLCQNRQLTKIKVISGKIFKKLVLQILNT